MSSHRTDRVPSFMVGYYLPLPFADLTTLSWAGDYPIDGLLHLGEADALFVSPGSHDGRFVGQVGQVGAAKASGLAGQDIHIQVWQKGLAFQVQPEDRFSTRYVWEVKGNPAVEAPSA